MAYRLDIIVAAGLAINMIAGMASAANQNPWAMYGGQRGANAAPANPFGAQRQKQPPQKAAPQKFGYEYAPLDKSRALTNPNNQRPNMQYQRQPYAQGFGFQPFGQGNFGGQFGFGMNFNPGFSQGFNGSGFPFGFGVPTMPFFGGSNNYGVPYQGVPYQGTPYQGVPRQAIPYQGVPGAQYGYPNGNPYRSPYGNPYGRTAPWGMGFPMF